MSMAITQHGSVRMQQRGLPPLVIEWLERYGSDQHDGRGAVVYYFDRKARRRLERDVGGAVVRKMAEWLDAYAVVAADGHVVTVGRRWKRIWH